MSGDCRWKQINSDNVTSHLCQRKVMIIIINYVTIIEHLSIFLPGTRLALISLVCGMGT